MSSPSGKDAFVVALIVFVLSFAILSGAGINLRNRAGAREHMSARRLRLLISLALAILAAIWMIRKNT